MVLEFISGPQDVDSDNVTTQNSEAVYFLQSRFSKNDIHDFRGPGPVCLLHQRTATLSS